MLKPNSAIVLDTHAWLWLIEGDSRMRPLAQHVGRMTICAISIWEIGMLVDKKRLALQPTVEDWVRKNLHSPFILQPLSVDISLRSACLPSFHGDPADRMIVASALELGQPLVTADRSIQQWFAQRPELAHFIFAI